MKEFDEEMQSLISAEGSSGTSSREDGMPNELVVY